jgi:hypothetical protein
MAKNFTFIDSVPERKSKTEQELEQARARSHAAKISHQRRKDEQRERSQLAIWTGVGGKGHDSTKIRSSPEDRGSHQQRSTRTRADVRNWPKKEQGKAGLADLGWFQDSGYAKLIRYHNDVSADDGHQDDTSLVS